MNRSIKTILTTFGVVLVAVLFIGLLASYWQAVQNRIDAPMTTQAFNWGGGEQLVFGMPVRSNVLVTPTPQAILVDHHAGAVVEISWEHYQIHEANSYRVDVIEADLDTDEELSICFKTPISITAELHFFAFGKATADSTFEIYESPVVTGGVEITPVNRKRADPITSTIRSISNTVNSVSTDATITTTLATMLRMDTGGSSTGAFKGATESQDEEELELATNTIYCAILTAHSDNQRGSLEIKWYEVAQ